MGRHTLFELQKMELQHSVPMVLSLENNALWIEIACKAFVLRVFKTPMAF